MAVLKPFRVRLASGLETNLMLDPETALSRYPDAREVKPGVVETKAPAVKKAAPRRRSVKKPAEK
ncbi:hypothetical protein CPHO_07095 [Corynebacterium phocae]|uniref:Uncharacterized protein n=1 Tax=Corynebacterium phocae TaxID=161895 RepID=A0A1L7D3F3_9CORY|nr:hypothetical protein [Corynebacterium phocae]APT92696.1 hypothetical protein CPHO_07095 [Corynebacterium phocae]KAA8723587.1 hypothetical protein F4V58_06600 [Corynebacterium phocae]